jgi:hypothetical protein
VDRRLGAGGVPQEAFRTLTELINYAATHGTTLTPGIKAAR